jgi:FkbM family methyltransferase
MSKLNIRKRNKAWLTSDIPNSKKLAYYPNIAYSIGRSRVSGVKKVNYLGRSFVYDNQFTPLTLQYYPDEITNKILKNMDHKPEKVLDIGGNIGQFICTLNYVLGGKIKADVFEPNPSVFEMLKQNTDDIHGINIHNLGVGKTGKVEFYFEPGRSGMGSLIKDNAGNKKQLKKIDVSVTDAVEKVTKKNKYDLLKIDVEGYELEVLKHLNNISTKYLFIEVSGLGRKKHYHHSELFIQIEKRFGEYDIVHSSELSVGSDNYDMLFRFRA